jgi:hypothetical protein
MPQVPVKFNLASVAGDEICMKDLADADENFSHF